MIAARCLVVSALVLLAGCAQPIAPTLDITPPSRMLVVGDRVELTATRRYPAGPFENVTQEVSFSSSDPNVAMLAGPSVLVAGPNPGSVLVRAIDPSTDATASVAFTVVARP